MNLAGNTEEREGLLARWSAKSIKCQDLMYKKYYIKMYN